MKTESKPKKEEIIVVVRAGRKIKIPKKEYDMIPDEAWYE